MTAGHVPLGRLSGIALPGLASCSAASASAAAAEAALSPTRALTDGKRFDAYENAAIEALKLRDSTRAKEKADAKKRKNHKMADAEGPGAEGTDAASEESDVSDEAGAPPKKIKKMPKGVPKKAADLSPAEKKKKREFLYKMTYGRVLKKALTQMTKKKAEATAKKQAEELVKSKF